MRKNGNTDQVEEYIKDILETHIGISCKKVPVRDEKTPDFVCRSSSEEVYIELKTKYESNDSKIEREQSYSSGNMHINQAPLAYDNSISSVVDDGVTQLKNTPDNSLKLIWLHHEGYHSDLIAEKSLQTIYGIEWILDVEDPSPPKECYYFCESSFFKHRQHLDAAIISQQLNNALNLKLCINNHSQKKDSLLQSSFYNRFISKLPKSIISPEELEKQELIYLLDSPHDRGEKAQSLASLEKKYQKSRLTDFQFHQYSASFVIPTE